MDALGEEFDMISAQIDITNGTVEVGSEKWHDLNNRLGEMNDEILNYQAQDELCAKNSKCSKPRWTRRKHHTTDIIRRLMTAMM